MAWAIGRFQPGTFFLGGAHAESIALSGMPSQFEHSNCEDGRSCWSKNRTMCLQNHHDCHPYVFAQPTRFHLRMDVRAVFCLWQSACNPSASLVLLPPVSPFRTLRETDPCLKTILEIYFQIPDSSPTYEIRRGTSQAHPFELERIGRWVLRSRTRP